MKSQGATAATKGYGAEYGNAYAVREVLWYIKGLQCRLYDDLYELWSYLKIYAIKSIKIWRLY
jgi:hypothetical protein